MDILRRLLGIKQLVVQNAESVWQALHLFESNKADFADCLVIHTAERDGCKRIMTFNKQAALPERGGARQKARMSRRPCHLFCNSQ